MRWFTLALLPIISIFLESTLFARFSIRGAVPDMVLLFVSFFAIIYGPKAGFRYGFLCGLVEDLYTGRFIGLNAVTKALTALFIGRWEVNVFKENILVGFGGTIIATLLNAVLLVFVSALTIPGFALKQETLTVFSGQLLYNALLSVPFYIWYYRYNGRKAFHLKKRPR